MTRRLIEHDQVLYLVGFLSSCCPCQNGSHQLTCSLIGGCSLASEFPKDVRRKRNIGDDLRSRRHRVGCNLLLQDTVELAMRLHFSEAASSRLSATTRQYAAISAF